MSLHLVYVAVDPEDRIVEKWQKLPGLFTLIKKEIEL
jgi:hypothetical protein